MKLIAAAFLLFVFFNPTGNCQQYSVSGTLTDTLNATKVPWASVVLISHRDSVIAAFTRSDDTGRFLLHVRDTGTYDLRVTAPGLADYTDIVSINQPVTQVGEIDMVSREHLLQEVVITKQYAAIKIKGDTTEYMADSFKVKDNANVEDLLKKLPGISVDKNGKITAQGEEVQKILVDGEEFFSDDPKVVTEGFQANAISKVQVYDKKSDQAIFTGIDDGQKTKTINLELKEDRKKGYFGKIDVGQSPNGYYQDQGMLNAFKGKRQLSVFSIASNTDKVGLGWTDNDKFGGGNGLTQIDDDGNWNMVGGSFDDFGGWDGTYNGQGLPQVFTGGVHYADRWNDDKDHFSGSYRYADQQVNMNDNNTVQSALTGDTVRVSNAQTTQSSKVNRNGIDALYELKIDSLTSVQVTFNAGYKTADVYSNTQSQTWERTTEDLPVTYNNRTNTSNINSQFMNSDFLFRRKFKKKGRTLSIDAKENYSNNNGTGHLKSNLITPDSAGNYDTSLTDQRKVENNSKFAYQAKATYTEPLAKTIFLQADYSVMVNNSQSENLSYNKNPGSDQYDVLDDTFSSNYKYNVTTNQGGLFLKFVYKKTNFSLGSEASNTNYNQFDLLNNVANRSYAYANLYPKATFNFDISRQTSISFSYSGNTKQPTIAQVQPLAQNADPLNITVGNPALKQEFTNRFNLRFHDYKTLTHRYFYVGLTYAQTNDAISTAQTIDGPVSTTQYVNVDGNYSFNAYAGYNYKLNKPDISIGFNTNANSNHVINYVDGQRNLNNNNGVSIGPTLSFDKQDKYNFYWYPNIGYNANTTTINSLPTNYWEASSDLNGDFQITKKYSLGTSATITIRQQTPVFTSNNQIFKWNAYVSRKLMKKNQHEVKLTVYDILNQNTGINRTANGSTITQDSYNTIRRYFMLSVLWNFNHNPATAATGAATN